jgi:hypothetical protein
MFDNEAALFRFEQRGGDVGIAAQGAVDRNQG